MARGYGFRLTNNFFFFFFAMTIFSLRIILATFPFYFSSIQGLQPSIIDKVCTQFCLTKKKVKKTLVTPKLGQQKNRQKTPPAPPHVDFQYIYKKRRGHVTQRFLAKPRCATLRILRINLGFFFTAKLCHEGWNASLRRRRTVHYFFCAEFLL